MICLQTEEIELEIDTLSGQFHWVSVTHGETLLKEKGKSLTSIPVLKYSTNNAPPKISRVKTVDGERNYIENLKPYEDRTAYRGKINFQWQEGEILHGLGQAEEGIYNYRGHVQYLYQHNMRTPSPFWFLTTTMGFYLIVVL
jgi:alpha-D-xyloside xylohydrolase